MQPENRFFQVFVNNATVVVAERDPVEVSQSLGQPHDAYMVGARKLDSTVAPHDNVDMNNNFSFPQYPVSHQMEDESVALLLSTRPDSWLVRTLPGRDIGNDGEIEIHDDRNFMGRLFKY